MNKGFVINDIDTPILNLLNHNEPCFMSAPTIRVDEETGEYTVLNKGLPWTVRKAIVTALMFPVEGDNPKEKYDLAHLISTTDLSSVTVDRSKSLIRGRSIEAIGNELPLMIRGAVWKSVEEVEDVDISNPDGYQEESE